MIKSGRWRSLVIESTAVILSILMAFAIDAWWETRQQRNEAQELVSALQSEIEDNLERIVTVKNLFESDIRDLDRFRDNFKNVRTMPLEEIRSMLYPVFWARNLGFSTSSITNAKTSGNIFIVKDIELMEILSEIEIHNDSDLGLLDKYWGMYLTGPIFELRQEIGDAGHLYDDSSGDDLRRLDVPESKVRQIVSQPKFYALVSIIRSMKRNRLRRAVRLEDLSHRLIEKLEEGV